MNSVRTRNKIFEKMIRIPEITVLIPVVVIVILGAFISNNFLTISNFLSMIRNASYIGIVSITVTFLLMSKGLDLSCDGVAAISSVLFAKLLQDIGLSPVLTLLITFAIAGSIGFINAQLITRLDMPSFIVTLGMLSAARGFALIVSNGGYIMIRHAFLSISSLKILGINIDVYIFIAIAVVAHIILKYTNIGRKIKLLGTNVDAATISGIKTIKIRTVLYILTALGACTSGVLFTMRSGMGMNDCGTSWALQSITACVIGGTSIYGGKGSVIGTVLGVLFMVMITNIMMLCGIQAEWQYVGIGMFIVLGVLLQVYRSNKLSI